MKALTLVRHAKSSWKQTQLADFDRPLNRRGELDAPEMGKRLKKQMPCPELIISSPATRALTTAKVLAQEMGYPLNNLLTEQRVYMASVRALLELINRVDNAYQDVMLVGHNPSLTDLANNLTGGVADNLPTCGVVRMTYEVDDWKEVGQSQAKLILFDYPKNTP